jgi:hypothetical protein
MRFVHWALLMTVICGCATQPQRVPPSPAVAPDPAVQSGSAQSTTAGSPPPTAAAQASAPTGSPAINTPVALAIDQDLVSRGYTPAIRHGQRVYCREQSVTGTHFTQKKCMTADQIKEAAESTKDYLNAPRPDANCSVMKCN